VSESLSFLLGLLFVLDGLAGGESAELRLFVEVVVRMWLTSSFAGFPSRLIENVAHFFVRWISVAAD
jgi:hypothetical protein